MICNVATFSSETLSTSKSPFERRQQGRLSTVNSSAELSRDGVRTSMKLCVKSLTHLHRGCSHTYSSMQRHANLLSLATSGAEKLATSIIKETAAAVGDASSSSACTSTCISLPNITGRPFLCYEKDNRIHCALSQIQSDLHLSSN